MQFFFSLIITFYSVSICFLSLSSTAQNLFDYEHSLEYARHLESAQNYKLAFREFERLSFLDPGNDSIAYNLLHYSLLSGNLNEGEKRIEQLYSPPRILPLHIANQYSRILILKNNTLKIDSLLNNSLLKGTALKKQILVYNAMWRGSWVKANTLLLETSKDTTLYVSSCQDIVNSALSFRRKSPILATALSVIPGGGKVYTKNFSDGLMSFFTIGFSSFLAYRGFMKNEIESIPGWFFGAMGTGFYISNFYGGYKSAKKYNNDFYESLHKDVEEIILFSDF